MMMQRVQAQRRLRRGAEGSAHRTRSMYTSSANSSLETAPYCLLVADATPEPPRPDLRRPRSSADRRSVRRA